MRWHVEAADTKTGLETEFTVEAVTAVEAERLAHYNGLLVSSIRKAGARPAGAGPAPVVAYAGPAPEEAAVEYPQLARRAGATRLLGIVLSAFGWVALAGGVGLFVYLALRWGWDDWKNWRAWAPPAARGAWRVVLGGAAALTVGSAMRLMAAMAMVLRGVAQSARRRRGRGGVGEWGGLGGIGDGVVQ